jgi:hypothetical protein
MLRCHIAYDHPDAPGEMVVAEHSIFREPSRARWKISPS